MPEGPFGVDTDDQFGVALADSCLLGDVLLGYPVMGQPGSKALGLGFLFLIYYRDCLFCSDGHAVADGSVPPPQPRSVPKRATQSACSVEFHLLFILEC